MTNKKKDNMTNNDIKTNIKLKIEQHGPHTYHDTFDSITSISDTSPNDNLWLLYICISDDGKPYNLTQKHLQFKDILTFFCICLLQNEDKNLNL
jgi:N-acetylglutamate synthase/N-acetylornithine aminotransferase